MRIKVEYCGYLRKNGTYNACTIDTEEKTYTNNCDSWCDGFVEAYKSRDVDTFRRLAIRNGYKEVEGYPYRRWDYVDGESEEKSA